MKCDRFSGLLYISVLRGVRLLCVYVRLCAFVYVCVCVCERERECVSVCE